MAGRHKRTQLPARRRRSVLPVAAITALVVTGVAGTAYLSRDRPASRTTAVISPSGCKGSGQLTLVVEVAPALAAPIRQIGQDWAATNPKAAGKCVQLALSSDPAGQQELQLAGRSAASTDIWLPDSIVWAQRLMSDLATTSGAKLAVTVHPSLASSPLVAVTSPDRALTMAGAVASPNFDPLGSAELTDPAQNAEGLLGMLSTDPALDASGPPSPAVVSKLAQLRQSVLASSSAGFEQLADDPVHAKPFVASEQAVVAANRQHGGMYAAAVYPDQPTLSLDFPVVRLSRAGADPALAEAGDEFEKALRTASARDRFSTAGLRAPDGSPIPGAGAAQGVTADLVPAAAVPTTAQTANLLRLWDAATATGNTLAVIDVSQSMAQAAGSGQSRIEAAGAAAKAAVALLPDGAALGLWAFSSDQSPTTPWAQLVPLGPLAGPVGPVSRRQALLAAAGGLAGRLHGGTALYDTAFAAYQQVQRSYDPDKVNSVVLLADGRDDYQGGRTLAGLLSALRAAADPQRPVRVITIGIGSGADRPALAQIATATGGSYYQAGQADDLTAAFLAAVAQRR